MTGNYLTTAGRPSALDIEMITDLGLAPTREAAPTCTCAIKIKRTSGRTKAK